MNIYLSSFFSQSINTFTHWWENLNVGKKVAFIPTANNNEEVTFFIDSAIEVLKCHGFTLDIIDISKLTPDESHFKISESDMIYISGGNTFYLLSELNRTGIGLTISRLIKEGMPFVGESAGSSILSPDIEYMSKMDDPSIVCLNSTKALNVIDFYPLPHYLEEPFEDCSAEIYNAYSAKIRLSPISNTQVILVDSKSIKIVNTETN